MSKNSELNVRSTANSFRPLGKTLTCKISRMECLNKHFIDTLNNYEDVQFSENFELAEDKLLTQEVAEMLCEETLKLKQTGVLGLLPIDKIVKMLKILHVNIKYVNQSMPVMDENMEGAENVGSEECLKKFTLMEDLSCACLNILTCQTLEKRVYTEDVVETLISYAYFKMLHVIAPLSSTRGGKTKKNISTIAKMSTIISLLEELVCFHLFADCLVVKLIPIAITPYIQDVSPQFRPSCLKLTAAIFKKYKGHRNFVLKSILASSERHLFSKNRSIFTINSEDGIQNVTGLVLILIQNLCFKEEKSQKNIDEEICEKISQCEHTAATFLKLLLNKCKLEEEGCRQIFEDFLRDLLKVLYKPRWPSSELFVYLIGGYTSDMISSDKTDVFMLLISLDCLTSIILKLQRLMIYQEEVAVTNIISKIEESSDGKFNKELNNAYFCQRILLEFSTKLEIPAGGTTFYLMKWYKDILDEQSIITQSANSIRIEGNRKRRKVEISPKEVTGEAVRNQKSFLLENIQDAHQEFQDMTEPITIFLGKKSYLFKKYDFYLKTILDALSDVSITIRFKALKCLTAIVLANLSLLERGDFKKSVDQMIFDESAMIREAVVDLVGKSVMCKGGNSIEMYYDMLVGRFLDVAVSVRKRVIKFFNDFCNKQPNFGKTTEIYFKILLRIQDEEAIQNLVLEIFHSRWFMHVDRDNTKKAAEDIVKVVTYNQHDGLDRIGQLFEQIFQHKKNRTDFQTSWKEMIAYFMGHVRSNKDLEAVQKQHLVVFWPILHIFAKIGPRFLIDYVGDFQFFLDTEINQSEGENITITACKVLELVLPYVEGQKKSFWVRFEESTMRLILHHDRPVVSSSLSCLAVIIKKVTKNYKLVTDCFKMYFSYLNKFENSDQEKQIKEPATKKYLRRALFSVGLLIKNFNFQSEEYLGDLHPDTLKHTFKTALNFMNLDDKDVKKDALKALGAICAKHPEYMMDKELDCVYNSILKSGDQAALKLEVLENVESYLIEDEMRSIDDGGNWKSQSLKEMCDANAAKVSVVVQLYLKDVLASYIHPDASVRHGVLRVVKQILKQGLVHPIEIVPYLICMTTDVDKSIVYPAEKELKEIEDRYPGFIHMKSTSGLRLSFEIQKVLRKSDEIVRGVEKSEDATSVNVHLYKMLRRSRPLRRALVLSMLRQFDDKVMNNLEYMLYLADNLAHFPYTMQEEPLFLVHQIDTMLLVCGNNILNSFEEIFKIQPQPPDQIDKTVEVEENCLRQLPEDISAVKRILLSAQGCILLLRLKEYLRRCFPIITDAKLQEYSPLAPAKMYEKNVTRKNVGVFNPNDVLKKLHWNQEEEKSEIIRQYLEFKDIMEQLVADDSDMEELRNSRCRPSEETVEENNKFGEAKSSLECCKNEPSASKEKARKKVASKVSKKKGRKILNRMTSGSESEDDDSDYVP